MPIETNKRLVIIDSTNELIQFHENDIKAYLSESVNGISISDLIVESKKILIREYIEMTYSLGFKNSDGISVHKNLLIRSNFSFWWMTLLAEKNPIRSSSIYKIFQFRTIEKLYKEKKCSELVLCSNDHKLHKLLNCWSKESGFKYQKIPTKSNNSINIYDLYRYLPNFLKASRLLIRYILNKRDFMGNLNKRKIQSSGISEHAERFIFCPFPGFNEEKASNGIFQSNFWGDVQPILETDVKVNFIFMYTPGVNYKNAQDALKIRDIFKNSNSRHSYYFLEEWLSFRVVLKIIYDYFFLYKKSFNSKAIKNNSFLVGSKNSYWSLFKEEWLSSTRGVVAIDGCIRLRLFEECLKSFKSSIDGFYLIENQPWERALNYSWKNNFNAPLFGVQNNPFRPFDLRFYEDNRVYYKKCSSPLPLPSLMLTNGDYSSNCITEFGYPSNMIKTLEAYKYSYLSKKSKSSNDFEENNKENNLLVILDGLHFFAKKQLKLLGSALNSEDSYNFDNVIIKPHPFCDVSGILEKYLSNVNYELTNIPLESLWKKANIVYVSNMTSAGIESLINGLPTIIYVDNASINLSPAIDFKGAMFASSREVFNHYVKNPTFPIKTNEYLLLDQSLKRWKDFVLTKTTV